MAGAAIAAGSTRPADDRLPPLALAMASIGAVAHAVVGLAMVPLGLVAPAWAIILLLIVWAALLALAVRQRRTRPQLFLAAPAVSAALTGGLLYVGGRFLHWMP